MRRLLTIFFVFWAVLGLSPVLRAMPTMQVGIPSASYWEHQTDHCQPDFTSYDANWCPASSPNDRFEDGPNTYDYVGSNPWTKFDPLGLFGDAYGEQTDEAQFQNDTGHPVKAFFGILGQQVLQLASLGSYSGMSHVDQKIGEALDNTQANANAMNGASAEQAIKIQQNQVGVVKSSLAPVATFGVSLEASTTTLPETSEVAVAEATVANAAAKDAAGASPSASARAVVEGEVGTYGDLKARSVVGDGLDIHEVPSSAAQIAAKEAQLGRELTPAEAKALKNSNPAVAVKAETHKLTDTYGAKNTPAQIKQDAANLPAAAARGAADVVQAGQATGSDLSGSAKPLQQMTPSN